jgi:hypothetical protein
MGDRLSLLKKSCIRSICVILNIGKPNRNDASGGRQEVECLENSVRIFPTDILLKHLCGVLETLEDKLSDHRLIFLYIRNGLGNINFCLSSLFLH